VYTFAVCAIRAYMPRLSHPNSTYLLKEPNYESRIMHFSVLLLLSPFWVQILPSAFFSRQPQLLPMRMRAQVSPS
jgi:hypothetical protein